MLDNFEPEAVREAVAEIKAWPVVPEIEVSGGVDLDTVARYAIEGVNFISVGAITNQATVLDMNGNAAGNVALTKVAGGVTFRFPSSAMYVVLE